MNPNWKSERIASLVPLLAELWRQFHQREANKADLSALAGELLRWPLADVSRVVRGWPGRSFPTLAELATALATPAAQWIGWSEGLPLSIREALIAEFGDEKALAIFGRCVLSCDRRRILAPNEHIAASIRNDYAWRVRRTLDVDQFHVTAANTARRPRAA